MMDPLHKHQEEPLPESLKRLLDEYRRKLWRAKILEALLAGVIGLALSFLVVFLLDRIVSTAPVFRLVILLAGSSLMAVFAPIWLRRWVWGHRKENELARLIAKKHPDFGDRLLGIIELQEQNESRDSMSPRLRSAAMATVAAQAEKEGLNNALPKSWMSKALIITAVLAIAVTAAFLFAPQAGMNAFKRWAMPLTETERYTFTKLASIPKKLIVPHGESFDLSFVLAADSQWQPERAQVRFGAAPALESQLVNGGYGFVLPPQFSPNDLMVSVGDARYSIRIEPTMRPVIEYGVATIKHPSYLQLSDVTMDVKTGVATAVEGSSVEIALTASRTLSSGNLGPISHLALEDSAPAESPPPGFQAALKVNGKIVTTPELPVALTTYDVPFSWVDELGLAGEQGYRLRIESVKDSAPATYIQGLEKQKVLLPEETLDFEVLAEDDFGLTELGLEWHGEATPSSIPSALAKGEQKLLAGNPSARQLSNSATFCPDVHKISPQKLILRAYTKDYHPTRGRIYSEPFTLFILTRDQHSQLLKNQFDSIVGELEEAARREQNALEENQRIERNSPEDLQKQENQEKLQAQQKNEQENTERVKNLNERMEKLLKDAARNGEIDKEVMKKMSQSMKSLSELSKEDMPKVDKKLGDSQQQNSTPEKAKQDVQDAVKEQQEVVEKMKKTLEEARDANKKMEAATFVKRLKMAASEESALVASLSETAKRNETGKVYSQADPSIHTLLKDLDLRQSFNLNDIRWIEEDLGHFFTRTNKEIYKEILEEMRGKSNSAGILSSLEEMRALLSKNHSMMFSNGANYWADQLNAWAKKLEGDDDQGGGGGGGEGGQPKSEDEDFEFMLRVMKMIQKQQDIRASTRALEELKRSAKLQ